MRARGFPLLLLMAAAVMPAMDSARGDEIEEIKAEIRKLQERVDKLEAERATSAEPATEHVTKEEPTVEEPATKSAAGVGEPDRRQPGTFEVFGHEVRWSLSAAVHVDVMHDFQALGLSDDGPFINEFITGQIPVEGTTAAERDHRTGFTVNQSTIKGLVSTPTPLGDFTLYTRVNFFKNDSGKPTFNLHNAWGKLGNLKGGIDYSAFNNQATIPNTLDYEGPNAVPELRHPFLQWIQPLSRTGYRKDLALLLSLEQPEADLTLPEGAAALNRVPDTVLVLRYEPRWANIQGAGLYRRLEARGAGLDDAVNGWGIELSGRVDTWGRDNFIFGAIYGAGIGSYIQDTDGFGLDAAPSSLGSSSLEAIPAFAGWVAYQHWWNAALRSTATYGYVDLDNTGGQAGDVYKRTTYVSANIIWSPISLLDVGLEYLYGEREDKDGRKGNDNRLHFSTIFHLTRGG